MPNSGNTLASDKSGLEFFFNLTSPILLPHPKTQLVNDYSHCLLGYLYYVLFFGLSVFPGFDRQKLTPDLDSRSLKYHQQQNKWYLPQRCLLAHF